MIEADGGGKSESGERAAEKTKRKNEGEIYKGAHQHIQRERERESERERERGRQNERVGEGEERGERKIEKLR